MGEPLTVLSLGWGVQSWTLAAMIALGELPPVDYAIHADTTHEASGTYTHAEKWTPWLEDHGVKVVTVQGKRLDEITNPDKRGILVPAYGEKGMLLRQCTNEWKIAPIRRYIRTIIEKPLPNSVVSIQGISRDEWHRVKTSDVKYITHDYPLVKYNITRNDCIKWLYEHKLDVPNKSSCVYCPFHDPKTWEIVKRENGEDWNKAMRVDENIRHRQSDTPIYLHRYRRPLPEAVRIPEDVGAKQLELMPCDSGYCFN